MAKKRCRTCRHCGKKFIPNPCCLNQKYCSEPECRKESNRASSRKWRRKPENRTPEKRRAECERVKEWQDANPGYKSRQRRKKRRKKIIEDHVLRETALAEKGDKIGVLRDLLFRQYIQLKGLLSHLFDVLRDDLGVVENRLYDIGLSVSGLGLGTMKSTRKSPRKDCNYAETDPRSGPNPPGAGTFFMGGPSTGP